MHSAASLLITGALEGTPQSTLNVRLKIQPLDLLAKFQASRSALRLREAG